MTRSNLRKPSVRRSTRNSRRACSCVREGLRSSSNRERSDSITRQEAEASVAREERADTDLGSRGIDRDFAANAGRLRSILKLLRLLGLCLVDIDAMSNSDPRSVVCARLARLARAGSSTATSSARELRLKEKRKKERKGKRNEIKRYRMKKSRSASGTRSAYASM